MPPCQSDHRYHPSLEDLPDSQGGPGRHKCAGCAFELGYDDGFEGRGRQQLNETVLLDSQAGTGRHKDVSAAYELGYGLGMARRHP